METSPEPIQYVDPIPSAPSFHKSCGIAVVLSQKVPKGEKHWNQLGPKQKSALELYDDLREKAGFDGWDVVYHFKDNGVSELLERSTLGERLTFARPIVHRGQSVEFGTGSAAKNHSRQHPHPASQPITAIDHR